MWFQLKRLIRRLEQAMAGVVHRFYCNRCDQFMYGEDPRELATAVNYHATTRHPADFANWDSQTILASANYAAPPSRTLPQYTIPHGTTSRKHAALPELTDEDRAMLAEGYVRWD
jgi:hypothetical protein